MTGQLKVFFLMAALSALLFTACTPKEDKTPQGGTGTYADYIDSKKTIAVQSGEIFNIVARDLFKAEKVPEYQNMSDLLEALRMGRTDAVMTNGSYIKQLEDSGMYSEFDYLWIPEELFANKSAPVFHSAELRDKYNEWFAGIKADGTFDEIMNRWIGVSLPAQEDIPKFEFTGENGTLRVCNTGNFPPYSYYDADGVPTGFDIDLISRFAQHLGMDLDISMMSFDAIIPYVISGKADMSACLIADTDERKESVLFGMPTIVTQAVLIVPNSAGRKAGEPASYTDFIGKRFAVKTGTIYDAAADDLMKSSEKLLFDDYTSIYEAVLKGKADAGLRGYNAAYISMFDSTYADLAIVKIPEGLIDLPVGAISADQDVIDAFNEFLVFIKANGMYEEMITRWIDGFDLENIPAMPEITSTGENGTLVVAISSDYIPFSFVGENGVYLGLEIELARRFASYMDKDINFIDMAFSGLLPYVMSGKADISLSDITITEERKKSVLFTDSYFIDHSAIIYRKDSASSVTVGSGRGFTEWLKSGIERNLITDNRWKMIANGLGVTMTIALLAQLLGTVFGCFVCWLLTRKNKFVKRLGSLYCGLIHGTPIVVLLMITYYIIFGETNISNVLVAVAAFSIITGSGVAENLKGAIDSVDPVEIEAARSIGFPAFKAFTAITLPQAVRRALPGYTNGFVELVKATAIVGYIAIQDLTRAVDIIRSRTYDAYFPLLFLAVIYLIVTTFCVQVFKLIIKKINQGGTAG